MEPETAKPEPGPIEVEMLRIFATFGVSWDRTHLSEACLVLSRVLDRGDTPPAYLDRIVRELRVTSMAALGDRDDRTDVEFERILSTLHIPVDSDGNDVAPTNGKAPNGKAA